MLRFLLSAGLFLIALTLGQNASSQSRAGWVSGNIYDAQGQPWRIPGSRVVVHIRGAGANSDRAGFAIEMSAGGRYEARVPHGLYGFQARAYLPINGQLVCVDLEPLDGRPPNVAQDSTPGIRKDFALRLSGPAAGGNPNTLQGYHGGSLTVTDGANWKEPYFGALSRRYPQGSKVVVQLVPQGALIDGSTGRPVTLECDLAQMQSGDHKADIPLGSYRATAWLVTPDGQRKPLGVALLPNLTYANWVDVVYGPNPEDAERRPVRPNLLVSDHGAHPRPRSTSTMGNYRT